MNASFEHKNQAPARQSHHKESQNAIAFPSRTVVHAKLEMTKPGDQDEQEADTVANAVVSGEKISRKISGSAGSSSGIAVSQQMESQLSHLNGGGRQMPDGLRSMMESGFGQDFSQVRLHTDSDAASMSSSIHAKAFTHGNDIYFNQGQFSPHTTEGQHLVAHELTHVAQRGNSVRRSPSDEDESSSQDKGFGGLLLQDRNHAPFSDYSVYTPGIVHNAPILQPQQTTETHFEKLKRIVSSGSVEQLIDLLIDTAQKEVGYKEKKQVNPNTEEGKKALYDLPVPDLDDNNKEKKDKEGNTIFKSFDGNENYTKYHVDLHQESQLGAAWCDWFVHWCFVKAFNPIDFEERNADDNNFYTIKKGILWFTMSEKEKMSGSVSGSMSNFINNQGLAFSRELTDEGIEQKGYSNNKKGIIIKKGAKIEKESEKDFERRIENADNLKSKNPEETSKTVDKYKELYHKLNEKLTVLKQTGTDKPRPMRGDIVFFIGHIGIVTEVSGNTITTIEGNTVKENYESEGNGVYEKKYVNNPNDYKLLSNYQKIIGFGRPNYNGLMVFLQEVYNKELYESKDKKNKNKTIIEQLYISDYPENLNTNPKDDDSSQH